MRKSILASTCLFAIGLSAVGAKAAIVLDETFDSYTDGNLVGQGAWAQTGTSAVTPIQVTTPTVGNNVASLGTSGQDVYVPFNGVQVLHTAGSSIETSMIINVTSAQSTGDYFSHLSDVLASSTDFFQRLAVKSSGSGYVIGLESDSGTGSAFTYGTTVLPFLTNESVDIVWNFIAGTTSDTFNVSVNGSPYAGLTSVPWLSASPEPTQLVEANLRQGSATAAPVVTVDNLEVQGTPSPLPEPASAGLLFGAASLLLGRRSRRA